MLKQRISVMQVIDGLSFGGAERMSVNLANMLPRERFQVHLCCTREEGPLAEQICPDVGRLALNRTTRLSEPRAVYRMVKYIRRNKIRILHCHENTVFLCSLVSLFCPSIRMIWHDHYGPVDRPRWLYKAGTLRFDAVISVNSELADWAREQLGFANDRVHFVNNFVVPNLSDEIPSLPERTGWRIICTANISPTKDLVNLVRAMALVVHEEPNVQTFIIGSAKNEESKRYLERLKIAIIEHNLEDRIFLLGSRDDVAQILRQCDVGVLCSVAEGLPLSLLEYGIAGLPAVATRVGQCAEVLGDGRYGILVPPGDPQSLANAIIRLLGSDSEREAMGKDFKRMAVEKYGPDQSIKKIVDVYDTLLR